MVNKTKCINKKYDSCNTPEDIFNEYLISFKLKNIQFRVFDARTNKITTMNKLPDDINKLQNMRRILSNGVMSLDLIKYAVSDTMNVIQISRLLHVYLIDTVKVNMSPTEYWWIERSANFGIGYLKKKNYTNTGYGYDFKNQYALALNSENKFPTKQGKKCQLKKLPDTMLKYHVMMTIFVKYLYFQNTMCI